MNRAVRIGLVSLLFTAAASADPVISEFMAANATTLKDGYGNCEDWIEIWNPDAAAVDLAGWRLTDNPSKPDKFVFPSRVVPANGRLVVFADGRAGSTGDATVVDPLGYLHLPFSLAKEGEYLALIKPDGVTRTTELNPFPAQVADVSYGPPESLETFVGKTTPARFKVPTNTLYDAASPDWTRMNFNDAAWTASAGGGVGFEAGAPLAGWLLDEEAGAVAAADCTGAGLGAALNGIGQTFGAEGAHAASATAVSLSGAGGLSVPFSASLNPPATFTFAAWVYPSGGSSHRTVVCSRVGPAGQQRGYILYLTPANTWEFWTGTTAAGGSWKVLSGGSAALNAWTHLAITRDAAGTKRIYVNGVLKASAVQDYQPNNNTANGVHLGCGSDTGTQYFFVGRIDDAAFWGHDIGAELVDQHRTEGLQSMPTPLYAAHYQTDVHDLMRGVGPGLYARHAFAVADRTRYSGLRLRVKYDDGFVAYLNGTEILRRNLGGARAFNALADGDRDESQAVAYEEIDVTSAALPALADGTNTLAVHGMTFVSNATAFLLAPLLEGTLKSEALAPGYFASATPGSPNVAQTVAPGPGLSEVSNAPAQPAAAVAVTVSARVTPRLGAIRSVSLVYRVGYGAESAPVAMADAGPVPGAIDGSRLYTGVIPASHGAAARQMLRYRLVAEDDAGRTWRAPYPTDQTDDDGVSQSPEYFGTVIADPALTASMPILQWFTADVTNSDTRIGARASVWYAGRFYDNLYVRQRGGYTSTGSQKFNFNRGENLWVNESLGKVGEVNLNSSGADPNLFRVSAAYAVYRAAGHPACDAFPVALYRNGTFQRLAHLVEQVDEHFLERRGFDPAGALYKFVQRLGEQNTPGNVVSNDYSGSPAFKCESPIYGVEKKTRQQEPFADYSALTAAIAPTHALDARRACLFRSLNLPNFVNFLALRALTGECDVNRKNFYAYRDSDGSQEWFLFPWDKDMTMGIGYSADPASNRCNPWQATDTFKHDPAGTRQWCVLWQNGYDVPEVRAMVGRRLRTLMDGVLGAPGLPVPGATPLEQRVDEVVAQFAAPPPGYTPGSSYTNRATFNAWLGQHRTALFTTFGPGSTNGMIPAAASGAPAVALASVSPAPDVPADGFAPQDHEYLALTNASAEAVDLSGWTLWRSGAAEPLFTFASGTVLPGVGHAPLHRLYVAHSLPGFRGRPGAPDAVEFAVGGFTGRLASASAATLELRAGPSSSSTLVSALAVPAAPSRAQQVLRLTELMFAPVEPSAAELALAPDTAAKDYEYLELENIGTNGLRLAGASFTEGVSFTFPDLSLAPGERVLVVANAAAFAARYGTGALVAGAFSGSLDNAGERLRLADAAGETILDFTYDARWFPPAAGGGYSLVARGAAPEPAACCQAASWALSGAAGGTPGAADNGDYAHHYDGWLRDHFAADEIYLPEPASPPGTLNAGLVGTAADPDGDGLDNLTEYAYAQDPRAPDGPAFDFRVLPEEGGLYAALEFARPCKALDLAYSVETARQPSGPWAADAYTNGPALDLGGGLERVFYRTPASAAPAAFLRLRVTK